MLTNLDFSGNHQCDNGTQASGTLLTFAGRHQAEVRKRFEFFNISAYYFTCRICVSRSIVHWSIEAVSR